MKFWQASSGTEPKRSFGHVLLDQVEHPQDNILWITHGSLDRIRIAFAKASVIRKEHRQCFFPRPKKCHIWTWRTPRKARPHLRADHPHPLQRERYAAASCVDSARFAVTSNRLVEIAAVQTYHVFSHRPTAHQDGRGDASSLRIMLWPRPRRFKWEMRM